MSWTAAGSAAPRRFRKHCITCNSKAHPPTKSGVAAAALPPHSKTLRVNAGLNDAAPFGLTRTAAFTPLPLPHASPHGNFRVPSSIRPLKRPKGRAPLVIRAKPGQPPLLSPSSNFRLHLITAGWVGECGMGRESAPISRTPERNEPTHVGCYTGLNDAAPGARLWSKTQPQHVRAPRDFQIYNVPSASTCCDWCCAYSRAPEASRLAPLP